MNAASLEHTKVYTLSPALPPPTCPAAVASKRRKGRGEEGEGMTAAGKGTS